MGRQEDARLAKLCSFARIGWWETDFTAARGVCSDVLADRLGLPRDGFALECFRSMIDPDYREMVLPSFDSRRAFDDTFPLRLPDGSAQWIYLKTEAAGDDGRSFGYVQLIDPPALKNPPQNVFLKGILTHNHEHNVKLLNEIFDRLPVGVELYDRDGSLLSSNDKDAEIFGYKREDIVSFNLFDSPLTPPEAVAALREGRDISLSCRYNLDLLSAYLGSPLTCRGYKDMIFRVSVLHDSRGDIRYYLIIVIDETEDELIRSRVRDFEAVFRLLSGYARVGYGKLNPLTGQGYASAQWFRNLGENEDSDFFSTAENLSYVHPEDRERILRFNQEAAEGRATCFRDVLRVVTPRQEEKWISVSLLVSCYEPQQDRVEIIGLNYDITEQKQAEEQLLRAKNRAEMMDRLKSNFLANMSHEIRTPLNAIVGFSRLLGEEVTAQERADYLGIIEENNALLLQLISDILDLSKIEAGTLEFVDTDVDVNRLCEEVIQSMHFRGSGGLALRFEPGASWCHVRCDKNRLHQVLSNFVSNALKFTERGSVRVGYQRADDGLDIYVEDTGAGIPADKQAQVFDRFVKLDNLSKGTGLGLSICQNVAERFGGRVGVSSEVGRGSRFWIHLPAERILELPAESVAAAVPVPEPVASPGHASGRPLILVAEDTLSNYQLLEALLRSHYELRRAHDGFEAVSMCAEWQPDLILMDIRMPGMDGLEATRLIRESGNSLPIVALTAFAYERDRQEALAAGCDDFLTKPLSSAQLREILDRWLVLA